VELLRQAQRPVINGGALLLAGSPVSWPTSNERVFAAAYDVTRELEKVTWPTRKETSAATVVVIVTVGISAHLCRASIDLAHLRTW
jgi:preprotein translocase SecE subunit